MTLSHNALVLVIDGRKMLFLRNVGKGNMIELETEAHHERGDGGSDGADSHQDEDLYAAEAGEQLRMRALSGDFDALAIVAPPRTLGELRKHLHKEVEKRIVMELAKEMTDRPIPDIAAMLMERSASDE